MDKILSGGVKEVYTDDGYGGISMLELNWIQDVIFERGDLNDAHESILEHFENRSHDWYQTKRDCCMDDSPYTIINFNS